MAYKHILVGHDLTDESAPAVDTGLELARSLRAKLSLVHVLQPIAPLPMSTTLGDGMPLPHHAAAVAPSARTRRREAQAALAREAKQRSLPELPIASCVVEAGDPGGGLADAVRELDADLLVVASHRRSGLGRFLLGSTTRDVHLDAPCAILIEHAR